MYEYYFKPSCNNSVYKTVPNAGLKKNSDYFE